jgi:uncharacterized protein
MKQFLNGGASMTENEKKEMNRRMFLKTTGIGGASLALSAGLTGRLLAVEESKTSPAKAMPKRVLGKTGVSVPILAMGGITDWTTNQALLRVSFNMGVTYWDTSYGYANGKSEIGIGQYFEKYPEDRKKIFLVSKATGAENPEGMTQCLNESLERMKTDHIDLYFAHGPRNMDFFSKDVKAWSEQKKKEGKIKFFGFSTHMNMSEMLMAASSMGWIDVIMPTYNYRTMLQDDTKKSLDACAKAGIGLVAMKVMAMRVMESETPENEAAVKAIAAGGYTQEQARLKAVLKDERIASACVAMYSLNVLKDNLAAVTDNKQLSLRDIGILNTYAENTRCQYCIGCTRCCSIMGSESRIPDVMRYMMYYNSYGERDFARSQFAELPESVKKIVTSGDFSAAEAICPQGIKIGSVMREATRILG